MHLVVKYAPCNRGCMTAAETYLTTSMTASRALSKMHHIPTPFKCAAQHHLRPMGSWAAPAAHSLRLAAMLPADEQLLCCFSPSGDALAIASSDGRVRTFETGTGRLRCTLGGADGGAAAGALTQRHTCLAWVGSAAQGTKKKGAAPGPAAVLVLGTASGDVKAFDTQRSELAWRSKNAVEGGVLALAYAPASQDKPAAIYATGASRQLVALDPATGQVLSTIDDVAKQPLSCLAVSPDASAAFCGSTALALWDLASQERRAKYTGHPTPASTACFVPSASHAVSASTSERHVAVWSTSKKSKKAQPAAASLSLEDPAVQLDACSAPQGADGFHVAAVSGSGEAYVWSCSQPAIANGTADGAAPELKACLLARVRVGNKQAKGAAAGASECILAARLQPGSQGPSLLVARGSSAKPVFETVALPQDSPTDGPSPVIALEPCPDGVLLPAGTAKAKKAEEKAKAKLAHTRQDVTVLGPDNQGQPIAVRALGAVAPMDGVEEPSASGRKRSEPEADAAEDEELDTPPQSELPLGQRVAALEGRAVFLPPPEGDDEAGPSGALPVGSAKADSLAVLLTQAIRSQDRVLLEKCLATTTPRMVTNSVRRLVPTDAAQLLRAAVDRVLTRPARAVQLAPWIKALMHYHTGYLMTAPSARSPLTALYQAIEGRVSLHQQMLRVYGRLSLITAHTQAQHAADAGADGEDDDGGMPAPEVVFEDAGDDEEPDAEDPFAPEGDDDGDSLGEGDEEDEEDGMDADSLGDEEEEEDDL